MRFLIIIVSVKKSRRDVLMNVYRRKRAAECLISEHRFYTRDACVHSRRRLPFIYELRDYSFRQSFFFLMHL